MDIKEAKKLVIESGLKLVSSGLIARTWGNVSCRIDKENFAITPSGKAYESLTEEDIVICKVKDCSYEGNVKPSSEKGVHALLYRFYEDVNFVIHTHQINASAVGAMDINGFETSGFSLLGKAVPVAKYSLPGSKKLQDGIKYALNLTDGHCVIMSHHGALCFGENHEEAFNAAEQLEDACFKLIKKLYLNISHKNEYSEKDFYEYYISSILKEDVKILKNNLNLGESMRTSEGFIFKNDEETYYKLNETSIPQEALLHQVIYQNRSDINFIKSSSHMALLACSLASSPIIPYVDDFAQIAGSKIQCAKSANPFDVFLGLDGNFGVLVPNGGALCCAQLEPDAIALKLVMEKGAFAQIAANLTNGKPLSKLDIKLMNAVYKMSYSKRNKSK